MNIDLIFIPLKRTLLSNTFNFEIFESNLKDNLFWSLNILFTRLKGISFNLKSKNFITSDSTGLFRFVDINFEFFINETILVDKSLCLKNNFNKIDIFQYSHGLNFESRISYPSYKLCPFVFRDLTLVTMSLRCIADSLIFVNKLEFIELDNDWDLNSTKIEYLILDVSYNTITSKLINIQTFYNVRRITFQGIISQIEVYLFKNLTKLTSIEIVADNLQVFIKSQDLSWLNCINSNINVTIDESNINEDFKNFFQLSLSEFDRKDFKQLYLYPDTDLCWFKSFPHNQLIFLKITTINPPNEISCTLLWLIKNDINLYFSRNFSQKIRFCNFSQKFQNCQINTEKVSLFFNGIRNYQFILKWFQFIMQVYFQTIFCVSGILANLLILYVIKNKSWENSNRNFDNVMYKHVHANSIFNILYCSLSLLDLINFCIFPKSSFCSQIWLNNFSQYLKIYIINFLGNAIRISLNFSFFTFSLSRYLGASKTDKSKCLTTIKNLNVKKFYKIIFVSSLIFSIFKIFQFELIKDYDHSLIDPEFTSLVYEYSQGFYCESYSDTPEKADLFASKRVKQNFNTFRCQFVIILDLINNILNNVVFFIANLIIDLCLVIFSGKNLARKKRLTHNDATNPGLIAEIQMKERIKRLVIVNNVFSIISHLPELVAFILVYKNEKENGECKDNLSCSKMIDSARSFSFLIITFQIIVFYKFDRNFRLSLKDRCVKFFTQKEKQNNQI
jgi:hypothetical protein